jgi:hypothetical protein
MALPSVIEKALKSETSSLMPTITVIWTEKRDPPLTAVEYGQATGFKRFDHKKTFSQTEKVGVTWQADGCYGQAFQQVFQPSDTDRTIIRFNLRHTFDGKIFYQHSANPNEIHLVERSDFENQAASDEYINMHYFKYMGFPLPSSPKELEHHVPLSSAILLLLAADDTRLTTVDTIKLGDTSVIRLRIERPALARDHRRCGRRRKIRGRGDILS